MDGGRNVGFDPAKWPSRKFAARKKELSLTRSQYVPENWARKNVQSIAQHKDSWRQWFLFYNCLTIISKIESFINLCLVQNQQLLLYQTQIQEAITAAKHILHQYVERIRRAVVCFNLPIMITGRRFNWRNPLSRSHRVLRQRTHNSLSNVHMYVQLEEASEKLLRLVVQLASLHHFWVYLDLNIMPRVVCMYVHTYTACVPRGVCVDVYRHSGQVFALMAAKLVLLLESKHHGVSEWVYIMAFEFEIK